MALRIEKAFGVKMDTLLRMQAWYDAHAMRRRSDEIQVRRYKPSAAQLG
jgi:plasmid maintenance system antidote protein VapI